MSGASLCGDANRLATGVSSRTARSADESETPKGGQSHDTDDVSQEVYLREARSAFGLRKWK